MHVSSVYGNAERLEKVVPELRKALPGLGAVIGCSTAGVVGMKGKGHSVEVRGFARCMRIALSSQGAIFSDGVMHGFSCFGCRCLLSESLKMSFQPGIILSC